MIDKKMWERIQKAYKEYSRKECYDETEELEPYPSDGILGLAYTYLGDHNEYDAQASYDLENQQYVDYFDCGEVGRRNCSLEEFAKTLEEGYDLWDYFIAGVEDYYYDNYEEER